MVESFNRVEPNISESGLVRTKNFLRRTSELLQATNVLNNLERELCMGVSGCFKKHAQRVNEQSNGSAPLATSLKLKHYWTQDMQKSDNIPKIQPKEKASQQVRVLTLLLLLFNQAAMFNPSYAAMGSLRSQYFQPAVKADALLRSLPCYANIADVPPTQTLQTLRKATGTLRRIPPVMHVEPELQTYTTTASGLRYIDVSTGSAHGLEAVPGQVVCMHLQGELLSGAKSRVSAKSTVNWKVNEKRMFVMGDQRCAVWEECITGMRVGGKRRILVPPSATHWPLKDQFISFGAVNSIPKGETARFDCQLVSIETGFLAIMVRAGLLGWGSIFPTLTGIALTNLFLWLVLYPWLVTPDASSSWSDGWWIS